VLARPHLVLPTPDGKDAVVGGVLAQLLVDVLRLQRAAIGLLVVQRYPAAIGRSVQIHGECRAWPVLLLGPTAFTSSSITRRQSPTIGTSGRPHLALFGGISRG